MKINNLARFLRSFWAASPKRFIFSVCIRVILAIIPLLQFYLGQLIIDEVVNLTTPFAKKDYQTLVTLVLAEGGTLVFLEFLGKVSTYFDWLLGEIFKHQTTLNLVAHVTKLNMHNFEQSEFHDEIEKINLQTDQRVTLVEGIFQQLQSLVTIASLVVGVLFLQPLTVMALLASLIPMLISSIYFTKKNHEFTSYWTSITREMKYIKDLQITGDAIKEIKIFGLSKFFKTRYILTFNQYFSKSKELIRASYFWSFIASTVGTLCFYLVYYLVILKTVNNELSIGQLVFISASFWKLRGTLHYFISSFSRVSSGLLTLNDYYNFFSRDLSHSMMGIIPKKSVPNIIQSGIEFKNVSFKYPNSDVWALSNLNVQFRVGDKIGIVGENGSGKSTFMMLLLRLYVPTEGRIYLDSTDINEFDLAEYHSQFSALFQDFYKFNLSARLNIGLGNVNKLQDYKAIHHASELGLSSKIIDQLPNSYDQILGKLFPGGKDLSGGQWQRIALSRVFMKDAKFFVFDEPTSALDSIAETTILDNIINKTEGLIVLFTTHKYSNIRKANRILVFSNGHVVETGSHDELMQKKGTYANLFEQQAREYR